MGEVSTEVSCLEVTPWIWNSNSVAHPTPTCCFCVADADSHQPKWCFRVGIQKKVSTFFYSFLSSQISLTFAARIVSLAGISELPEDAEKSAAEVLNATWQEGDEGNLSWNLAAKIESDRLFYCKFTLGMMEWYMEWAFQPMLGISPWLGVMLSLFENCPAAKVLDGTMRLMQCLAEAKEVSKISRIWHGCSFLLRNLTSGLMLMRWFAKRKIDAFEPQSSSLLLPNNYTYYSMIQTVGTYKRRQTWAFISSPGGGWAACFMYDYLLGNGCGRRRPGQYQNTFQPCRAVGLSQGMDRLMWIGWVVLLVRWK